MLTTEIPTDFEDELLHYIAQVAEEMYFITDVLSTGSYRDEDEAVLRAALASFTAHHTHADAMRMELQAAKRAVFTAWHQSENPIVRVIVSDYETHGTLRF